MLIDVTRYINGIEVGFRDLKTYELDSDLILQTIKAVNARLSEDSGNPKKELLGS